MEQQNTRQEISEEVLQASHLEWTVIRPPALTDGPHTGVYRVGAEHVPSKGKGFPGLMWPILCSNNS